MNYKLYTALREVQNDASRVIERADKELREYGPRMGWTKERHEAYWQNVKKSAEFVKEYTARRMSILKGS